MNAIQRFLSWLYRLFFRPATQIGLGVLLLIGFAGGVWFWWGFNKGLEATNQEKFCLSCHTMRENILPELKETIHWKNRTGVRAHCPDCHVPHNFTDKAARKMQASREVWGEIVGSIGTREKFLERRAELAQHEWARFKANNSKECKNCHDYKSMDFSKMRITSQMIMRNAAERNASCLDCHKGIAHHLPTVRTLRNPAFESLLSQAKGASIEAGKTYYTIVPQEIFATKDLKTKAGQLEVATPVKVLAHNGDATEVELTMWRKNKGFGRVWYGHFGLNIVDAVIAKTFARDAKKVQILAHKEDPLTGLEWQQVRARFWMKEAALIPSLQPAWTIAEKSFRVSCSVCHRQPNPADHAANQWPGLFGGMVGFTSLDKDSARLVLKYLQMHSADFAAQPKE